MKPSISHRRLPALVARSIVLVTLVTACVVSDKDRTPAKTSSAATDTVVSQASAFDTTDITAPVYAVDTADTAGIAQRQADSVQADPTYKRINEQTSNAALTQFPAKIPKGGPTALHVEILLDRAGFSPGIIDGAWGANAARALAFFRGAGASDTSSQNPKLDSGSVLEKSGYEQLLAAAGSAPIVAKYSVTADDVKGPFVKIPENVYDKAKIPCLCYESAAEALAEKFHASPRLLKQLNPGIDLSKIAAGTSITVPNVLDVAAPTSGTVAKLIVSKTGFWTHAVDSAGHILNHFPSTLGAGYDPSPTGDFHVTGVAHNPPFHYQPTLFAEVPDNKPTARLPAGPNSPVGTVWIGLSKPHYGIHGTSSPESIGYANSHGCVRLTNWDAERLSKLVRPGVPVVFQ